MLNTTAEGRLPPRSVQLATGETNFIPTLLGQLSSLPNKNQLDWGGGLILRAAFMARGRHRKSDPVQPHPGLNISLGGAIFSASLVGGVFRIGPKPEGIRVFRPVSYKNVCQYTLKLPMSSVLIHCPIRAVNDHFM